MDAIILAGALNTGPLQTMSTARYEAEIEIAGRPMLDYIILALKEVSSIQRIVVSGPDTVVSEACQPLIYKRVDSGNSLIDSLINGLNGLNEVPGNGSVLIVTSDIPLLNKEAVEDFLDNCGRRRGGDVYYSFIDKKVCEAKYPGVTRTYVKLNEGVFTGGNMTLVSESVIRNNINMLNKAVTLRKKPLKLASLLGWKCLINLMTGKLTIGQIETRVSKIFGFRAFGVISKYPEIGIDVDKPSDLLLARRILAGLTH